MLQGNEGSQFNQLTPLNWSVAFNRSSVHLSNQLRGKRFSAEQLLLFGDAFEQLPVEVQESARAAGIKIIGFDFTVSQQQAFEAALFLINASKRQRRIRIRPLDWIEAYQLRNYRHTEGYLFKSYKQREEAFKALVTLATKPFLICYKKIENGREANHTRIAPLWRLELIHFPGVPKPRRMEDLTVNFISKAECFELVFDDIWFDQLDNFYFYKPKNLFERIRFSLPGPHEKIPASLHPFLEWVFAEAGRLRTAQKDNPRTARTFVLRANWHEVALQSRLNRQLEKRNYKRAQEMLRRNAEIAQKAGILNDFKFDGSEFAAGFNPKLFDELESYIEEHRKAPMQRARTKQGTSVDAPPWNPKCFTPFQIRDTIKMWQAEIERLREKIRWHPKMEMEANEEIRRLKRWIQIYENVLYGRVSADI